MSDNFADVGAFHARFGLPVAGDSVPHFLDNSAEEFRVGFMREELNEFVEACRVRNLPTAADSLVDLVYVVLGTAHMMGLPWHALWNEVQRANMTKERASGSDDPRSKRGSSLDVVKPLGWKPPDIAGVLAGCSPGRGSPRLAAGSSAARTAPSGDRAGGPSGPTGASGS